MYFPQHVTLDGENGASMIQVGQIRCDEKHFAWEKKVYHENISSVEKPYTQVFWIEKWRAVSAMGQGQINSSLNFANIQRISSATRKVLRIGLHY